jgi:outer membrane protein OmpA-like peptidoglycan-associated protein
VGQLDAGDVRLFAKVAALRSRVVDLSLLVAAGTGAGGIDPTGFRSDGVWTVEPRVILEVHFPRVAAIINLGARLHEDIDVLDGAGRKLFTIGQELTWGAGLRVSAHRRVALALELLGSESLAPVGDAQRTLAVLASLFGEVGRNVWLFAGIGRSLAPDAARTDVVRAIAGLAWRLEVVAPPPPELAPPVPAPSLAPALRDRDGDLIPDARDQCPDDPEDRDGYLDEDGCPDPDNDGDGVPDANDLCPNEPETANGYQDQDGCPDALPAESRPLVAPPPLEFARGDGKLRGAQPVLDHLADQLLARPKGGLLRLEGHADPLEGKRVQELSERRAEAVREYLIGRGVDAKRLQSVGYGAARPVDKPGSEKNRRVEFIIVDEGK